jgi:RNA recognition motif-containing protein
LTKRRVILLKGFQTVNAETRIVQKPAGKPAGFGFVEMGRGEHADQTIRDLNGQEMDGRQLTVNEARERSGGSSRY